MKRGYTLLVLALLIVVASRQDDHSAWKRAIERGRPQSIRGLPAGLYAMPCWHWHDGLELPTPATDYHGIIETARHSRCYERT